MCHFNVSSYDEFCQLLVKEAGVDIYHVSYEDVEIFLKTGSGNHYFHGCMEEILASMMYCFPNELNDKRWTVYIIATVSILKLECGDVFGKYDEMDSICSAIKKLNIIYPLFISNMERYGYKLNRLLGYL
jgi:hypothetical protein